MYPYKFIFSNDIKNKTDLQNKILCGIVKDENDYPIKDAIVKISSFDEKNSSSIYIITDNDGEFIYGPLKKSQNINIKVWIENIQTKEYIINTLNNA